MSRKDETIRINAYVAELVRMCWLVAEPHVRGRTDESIRLVKLIDDELDRAESALLERVKAGDDVAAQVLAMIRLSDPALPN